MPRLQVIDGPLRGESFEFQDTVFIGRSFRNDIQIKDSTISRKQMKLYFIGEKLFLEDLKSTNGTWLNNRLIQPGEGFELESGDTICLGKTIMLLDGISLKHSSRMKAVSSIPPKVVNAGNRSPQDERRKKLPGDLETMYALSKLIGSGSDLQKILASLLEILLNTLPRIDRAAVILTPVGKKTKREVVSRSRKDSFHGKTGFSGVVIDRVIREGKAVRMSNTDFEVPSEISENESTLEIGSLLCVPLISRKTPYGVLYVDSLSGPYAFRKDDLLFLNAMSGPIALAIENAHLRER